VIKITLPVVALMPRPAEHMAVVATPIHDPALPDGALLYGRLALGAPTPV